MKKRQAKSVSDSAGPKREAQGSGAKVQMGESAKALLQDMVAAFALAKRTHRALYRENPKGFRAVVRKAENQVLRLKPGPKQKRDPRLGLAARAFARGTPFPELYPVYIDGYRGMTEHTRDYAEAGFRGKVYKYLRTHPRSKSPKEIEPNNPEARLKSKIHTINYS